MSADTVRCKRCSIDVPATDTGVGFVMCPVCQAALPVRADTAHVDDDVRSSILEVKYRGRVGWARTMMLVIGFLSLALALFHFLQMRQVLFSSIDLEPLGRLLGGSARSLRTLLWFSLGITAGMGAVFIALAMWAKTQPLRAAAVGLGLYVAGWAIELVIARELLTTTSFVVKGLVTLVLLLAVVSGLRAEALARSRRATTPA